MVNLCYHPTMGEANFLELTNRLLDGQTNKFKNGKWKDKLNYKQGHTQSQNKQIIKSIRGQSGLLYIHYKLA